MELLQTYFPSIPVLTVEFADEADEVERALVEEYYCTAPGCDCHRVSLCVLNVDSGEVLATISHGLPGWSLGGGGAARTHLSSGDAQGPDAHAVLKMFEAEIIDASLDATLAQHYAMMKSATSQRPARRVDDVGRNDPCPCGSGSKYKKCCLRKSKSATVDPAPAPPMTREQMLQRAAKLVSHAGGNARIGDPRLDGGERRKSSDVLGEFGRPLIEALGPEPGVEALRDALKFAIFAWNALVVGAKDGAEEAQEEARALVDGIGHGELAEMWWDELCERKARLFPDDNRIIADVQVRETASGFSIDAVALFSD